MWNSFVNFFRLSSPVNRARQQLEQTQFDLLEAEVMTEAWMSQRDMLVVRLARLERLMERQVQP